MKMGGLSQLPLLESVSKYLPRLLIRQQLKRPPGQSVFGDFFEGSLLFADISGFTTMSEKLAASGKRGAEELTSIMNRAFDSLTRIIFRHGGDILKFGGDAVLVFFHDDRHPLDALRCGRALQEYMCNNRLVETSQGVFPLELHLGVHSGTLLSASVGEAKSKLEHIVLGRDVNLTFRAADQAASGEMKITPDCYERVSDNVEVQPGSEDLLLVRKVLEAPTPPLQADPCPQRGDPLALKAYLPVGIYDKLQALQEIRGVEAEHRRVTVMFVNFHDFSDFIEKLAGNQPGERRAESKEELLRLLNLYFTRMHRIISDHGGVLTRIDTYSKGDKMLILFGAPVSHEDDELRGLHCALEMNSELEKINRENRFRIWQRIGINSGHAFCGDVGGSLRKEYTVMGDDVNLAARLMSKAEPGQILVGQNTHLKALERFDFSPLPPLKVKGKKEPLKVHSLEAKRSAIATRRSAPSTEVKLIGREKEVETLRQTIEEVLSGRGEVILVTGEAGMGKSRLTQELKRIAEQQGLGGFETACQSYGGSIPYLPWNSLLRELLEIGPEAEKREVIAKLKKELSRFHNPDWYPLLGSPLGMEFPDNDTTAPLEGRLRQDKTFQLIAGVLENRLRSSRFYIIFEDLHWIDEVSHLLLKFIIENLNDSPLLLVVVSRPHESLAWWIRKKPRLLDLKELAPSEAHHLVESLLKTDKPPEELTELAVEKSQGNPFFLEEIIHSLLDSEILVRNPETGGYELKGSISEINLPDNIEGVIQSRIDLLDETSKQVLKVAAILGTGFSFEALKVIFPYSLSEEMLESHLGKLSRLDLTPLDRPAPYLEYIFKHIMTQEVAYNSQPFEKRRRLHQKAGEYFQERHRHDLASAYEVLAYHFSRSPARHKAFEYLLLAGEKSQRSFANKEAIRYFSSAEEVWEKERDSLEEGQIGKIETLYRQRGEVLKLLGEYDTASSDFQKLLSYSRQVGEKSSEGQALNLLAEICWLRGEYPPALKLCNAALELTCDLSETSVRALALYGLGEVERRRGHFDVALRHLESALGLFEEMEEEDSQARTLNNIGISYWSKGELKEALKAFQQAMEIRRSLGDRPGVATALNNIGLIYSVIGPAPKALKSFTEASKIFQEIGDTRSRCYCLGNVGFILRSSADYSAALDVYLEALAVLEKIGDELGQAYTLNNLGDVYQDLHDLESAFEYHRRTLKLAKKIDDSELISEVLANLGNDELLAGNRAEAKKNLTESLGLAEKIGAGQMQLKALTGLLDLSVSGGEYEQAKGYWSNFEQLVEDQDALEYLPKAKLCKGLLEMNLGEVETAEESLREGREIAEKTGNRRAEWELHFALARLYQQKTSQIGDGFLQLSGEELKTARVMIQETAEKISDQKLERLFLTSREISTILAAEERPKPQNGKRIS